MDIKNQKLDIIIQAGQSNAEGCGIGPVEAEYVPCDSILYLTSDKTVVEECGGLKIDFSDKPFSVEVADVRRVETLVLGDFSLSFAEEYLKNGMLEEGRRLLVVRAAIGGTGFCKGHWRLEDALYKKMLEMTDYALSLNGENRVVGILWHQGECDAFEGNTPAVFFSQLSALLEGLRDRYGRGIPFVAGDFCYEWKNKNLDSCVPIVQGIKDVTAAYEKAAFVETEDLKSNNQMVGNGDDIHFCRQSLAVLGRRYFKAFREIKG